MPRLFLSPPNAGVIQRLDFHVQTALVEKIMHRFGATSQSAVIVNNDEARCIKQSELRASALKVEPYMSPSRRISAKPAFDNCGKVSANGPFKYHLIVQQVICGKVAPNVLLRYRELAKCVEAVTSVGAMFRIWARQIGESVGAIDAPIMDRSAAERL